MTGLTPKARSILEQYIASLDRYLHGYWNPLAKDIVSLEICHNQARKIFTGMRWASLRRITMRYCPALIYALRDKKAQALKDLAMPGSVVFAGDQVQLTFSAQMSFLAFREELYLWLLWDEKEKRNAQVMAG
ncbi:MAG: hypothetical protein ACYS0H_08780 [Planctomycetota bacterium]